VTCTIPDYMCLQQNMQSVQQEGWGEVWDEGELTWDGCGIGYSHAPSSGVDRKGIAVDNHTSLVYSLPIYTE